MAGLRSLRNINKRINTNKVDVATKITSSAIYVTSAAGGVRYVTSAYADVTFTKSSA